MKAVFSIIAVLLLWSGAGCTIWTIIEVVKYFIHYSASISGATPFAIEFNWFALQCTIGCYVAGFVSFGVAILGTFKD